MQQAGAAQLGAQAAGAAQVGAQAAGAAQVGAQLVPQAGLQQLRTLQHLILGRQSLGSLKQCDFLQQLLQPVLQPQAGAGAAQVGAQAAGAAQVGAQAGAQAAGAAQVGAQAAGAAQLGAGAAHDGAGAQPQPR